MRVLINLFQTQRSFRRAAIALSFICFAVFAMPPSAALGHIQDDQKQDSADSGKSQEAKGNDGQADLDEAFELKINATEPRDFDKIVGLCKSAIEKGLDDVNKAQAVELMVSTLVQHAEQYLPRIVAQPRDRRWRIYRTEALSRLEKAIEAKENLLPAHILIAQLNALEGGNVERAELAISKAIELASEDPQQLSQALTIRATISDDEERQINDLSQAIKIDPANTEALALRSELFLRREEIDKALDDLSAWSRAEPDRADAILRLVGVLNATNRNEEALEKLSQFIERAPESTLLFSIRARLNMELKNNEAALADAEKSLQLNKDNPDALMTRAILLADNKDSDGALRDINRLLQLSPGNSRGLWIRSLILASKKEYDSSLEDLQKLARGFPDVIEYQMQMAAIYNAKEEPQTALKIYDQLIEQNPDAWRVYRGRGDARLSLGQHAEAIADYERALELHPQDEEDDGLLNNLAWVLSTSPVDKLRDGKRAVELSIRSCELTEYKMPHILSTLASSYAEIDDFENAIKWIDKALELYEGDSEDLLDNLKREKEAYTQGRKWRELQEPGKKSVGYPAPLPSEKSDK